MGTGTRPMLGVRVGVEVVVVCPTSLRFPGCESG